MCATFFFPHFFPTRCSKIKMRFICGCGCERVCVCVPVRCEKKNFSHFLLSMKIKSWRMFTAHKLWLTEAYSVCLHVQIKVSSENVRENGKLVRSFKHIFSIYPTCICPWIENFPQTPSLISKVNFVMLITHTLLAKV